jgi:hypothetical protein
MLFMIGMALMPCPVAGSIIPIGHEPNLVLRVLRSEHVHPYISWCTIDKVGTGKERLLDCGSHVIGYDKLAQNPGHLVLPFVKTTCTRSLSHAAQPKEILSLRQKSFSAISSSRSRIPCVSLK